MPELTDKQIDGWWDVARAGRWKGAVGGAPAEIEINPQDLVEMAADYDPLIQEAPVTVEHTKQGPAHGWVQALRVAGDRLQARFQDLSQELRLWLESGAYRSRSIEMYKPFEPTGRAYLGAVSFLGAAPPAVKGLSPEPSLFTHGTACNPIRVEAQSMVLEEAPIEREAQMDEKTIAERVIHSLKEMFAGRPEEQKGRDAQSESAKKLEGQVAELKEALEREKAARTEAEERLAGLDKKLAEVKREAELAEFTSALEEAAAETRITPAELKGYLKLGSRLDEDGRRVILEEVAQRQPSAIFRELAAPPEKAPGTGSLARKRARFESFPEDSEHDAALGLMAANPELSFAEAIKQVRLEAGSGK